MHILIDYLVFTSKIHSLPFFIGLLGLSNIEMQEIRSYYGFEKCLYFDGIKIHYGGREDICVDMSGTGCRTLERLNNGFDWFSLFESLKADILNKDVHISRLDIACDDFDEVITFKKLKSYFEQKKFICKSQKAIIIDGSEQSVIFGSPKSDRRLRIYNKGLEKKVDYPWFRAELQLRNDNALSFLLNWFNQKGDIGSTYYGVLVDYLRFITVSKEIIGKNHNRCVIADFWKKFTNNAKKIKQLYLDKKEYNYSDLLAYWKKGCSSTFNAILLANNGDLTELLEISKNIKLNDKQLSVINRLNL